jgi:hypothetical protein
MTWWCDVTQHFVTELQAGLDELVAAHPERVMSARGTGTLCAIDCASVEDRTALVAGARARGVLIGVCGEKAIRFRPSVATPFPSDYFVVVVVVAAAAAAAAAVAVAAVAAVAAAVAVAVAVVVVESSCTTGYFHSTITGVSVASYHHRRH